MKKRRIFVGAISVSVAIMIGLVYGTCKRFGVGDTVFDNIEALSSSEEIVITCGQMENMGKCWKKNYHNLRFCNEYSYYECEFTGMQIDYCHQPC